MGCEPLAGRGCFYIPCQSQCAPHRAGGIFLVFARWIVHLKVSSFDCFNFLEGLELEFLKSFSVFIFQEQEEKEHTVVSTDSKPNVIMVVLMAGCFSFVKITNPIVPCPR